jgi:hypothetical protein
MPHKITVKLLQQGCGCDALPPQSAPPRRHGDQLAALPAEAERATALLHVEPHQRRPLEEGLGLRLSELLACIGTNPAEANTARDGAAGCLSMAAARWRDTTRSSTLGWTRNLSILATASTSAPEASTESSRHTQDWNAWNVSLYFE